MLGSVTPAKDIGCLSPATTAASASIKPSWADLSEDVCSTGLESDSQGPDDAPLAHHDVDSDSAECTSSRRRDGRRRDRKSQGGRNRRGQWTPTARGAAVNERWLEDSAPKTRSSRKEGKDKCKRSEAPSSFPWDVPSEAYCVMVEGMPARLCNQVCLDAILHQAGLQGEVVSQRTRVGSKGGAALIEFTNWFACCHCFNHFAASSWSGEALTVTVHCPDEQIGGAGAAPDEDGCSSTAATDTKVPEEPSSEDSRKGSLDAAEASDEEASATKVSYANCCGYTSLGWDHVSDHFQQEWADYGYFDVAGGFGPFGATAEAHQMALASALAHARSRAEASRQPVVASSP